MSTTGVMLPVEFSDEDAIYLGYRLIPYGGIQ